MGGGLAWFVCNADPRWVPKRQGGQVSRALAQNQPAQPTTNGNLQTRDWATTQPRKSKRAMLTVQLTINSKRLNQVASVEIGVKLSRIDVTGDPHERSAKLSFSLRRTN